MKNSEFLPIIDAGKCIGCGLCVKLCPTQALALVDDRPSIANPAACDYHGLCQDMCPTGAVSLTFELVW